RALIALAFALAACGQQQGGSTPSSSNAPAPAPGAMLTPVNLPAFFDCLRTRSQTLVSAHRGGPARGFAENSIETFEHTLVQAPAFMEVDIARTRDGQLVLMHDDTVDRTTNGTGDVASLTLRQFQALRLKDDGGALLDAHPPSLRQALDWARGRTVLELD